MREQGMEVIPCPVFFDGNASRADPAWVDINRQGMRLKRNQKDGHVARLFD